MRVSIVLTTAVLVTHAAVAFAVCESTDACVRAIAASQRETRTLAARFEQTKHLSLMSEPLVSRGQFAFKAPDQVLWQIDEPKVTVRIDQHGVHLPDLPNAEAEMAALGPLGEMMRELTGLFTGSLGSVQKSFDVTATGDAAAIRLRLVARSSRGPQMFRSIDLTFAAPALVIDTIHIDEDLGDSLEIVFSDVHRNDAVADAAISAASHD
jgi:outer membrane lipoprotein-sorting protein